MGCARLNNWLTSNLINLQERGIINFFEQEHFALCSAKYNIIDVSSFLYANIAMLINKQNFTSSDRLVAIDMFCNQFLAIMKQCPKKEFYFVFDFSYIDNKDNRQKIMNRMKKLGIFCETPEHHVIENSYKNLKEEECFHRHQSQKIIKGKNSEEFIKEFNEYVEELIMKNKVPIKLPIYNGITINNMNNDSYYNYLVIKNKFRGLKNANYVMSSSEADIAIGSLVNKLRNKAKPYEISIFSNDSDMITFAHGANVIRTLKKERAPHKTYMKLYTNKLYENEFKISFSKICMLPLLLGCDYTKNNVCSNLQDALVLLRTTSLAEICKQYLNNDYEKITPFMVYFSPELFDRAIEYRKYRMFKKDIDEFILLSFKIKFLFQDFLNINNYTEEKLIEQLNFYMQRSNKTLTTFELDFYKEHIKFVIGVASKKDIYAAIYKHLNDMYNDLYLDLETWEIKRFAFMAEYYRKQIYKENTTERTIKGVF